MLNEWWFLIGFIILLIISWFFITLPLSKKVKIIAAPIIPLIVFVLYSQWGSWQQWQQHETKLHHFKQLQAEMDRFKSPEEIIEKFKTHLKEKPNSAKGWYLLGRLYAGQGKWLLARDAFMKALSLDKKDENIQLNYLLSLWEINHRHFDKPMRSILNQILKSNPQEPNALLLAGKEAEERNDYQKAIHYWQILLTMVDMDSKEGIFLRKAIAKASSMVKKERSLAEKVDETV